LAAPAPLNNPWPALERPDLAVPPTMRRETFRAMGTTISLLLPDHAFAVGAMVARTLFATWEQALSRFRPDSELSQLNANAGAPLRVSPLLYNVLATALEAARATGGLFDPTMLRQIANLGYDRSFETLPAALPNAAAPATLGGGWRDVLLDPDRREVTLPLGIGIDLGGIAKGMAVDATITRLRALGISMALVNGGGDIAILGIPPGADSWSIAVPGRDQSWAIPLRLGALATSGRSRRHWRQGEQERHHLLDPRTGVSAETSLLSVTAVAASCALAEVAAKVAFVLGTDAGVEYLEFQGLAALLVEETGAWRTAGHWPLAAMQREIGAP
jgi:thiamine biosynthesis lipoprotein